MVTATRLKLAVAAAATLAHAASALQLTFYSSVPGKSGLADLLSGSNAVASDLGSIPTQFLGPDGLPQFDPVTVRSIVFSSTSYAY